MAVFDVALSVWTLWKALTAPPNWGVEPTNRPEWSADDNWREIFSTGLWVMPLFVFATVMLAIMF